MGRPRVLLVSHVAGLDGGAERSLLELASGLHDLGSAEVEVVVPTGGDLSAALAAAGVPTHVAPVPRWAPWEPDAAAAATGDAVARSVVRDLSVVRRLGSSLVPARRLLAAVAPDVVVTNTATVPTYALVARAAGIPHVWSVREFVRPEFHYLLGEPVSQRLIGRLSAAVVFNSDAVRRHFHPGVPIAKGVVVHPAVPLPDQRPERPREGAGLRLLLLGRMIAAKGAGVAIEGVAAARRAGVEVSLRVVGPGAERDRRRLVSVAAEHGVADHVDIEGFDPDPGLRMRESDVVVVASDAEAFGRVTVEALRVGRPVLATRTGGSSEIVADGVNGLLFEPGDAADLGAKIAMLATDPRLLRRLTAAAAPSISARFLPEVQVRAFDAVLRSVVAR